MCTKTKTSFGCGHCIKVVEDCGIPGCQTLEKWKISKPVDCGRCRASGEAVTRGKDGRGRHGREIRRDRESRQSSADTVNFTTDNLGTPHMVVSPWAPKTPDILQEKSWNTPTRQKADEAWLVEHERRMSDLEDKTSKMSIRSSQAESRKASPRESYEREIEIVEVEDDFDMDLLASHPKTPRLLPYEIEEASKPQSSSHSHSQSHRRTGRKVSHDSEGSMPHYQESPMMKTPRRKTHFVPPVSEYNPHDQHSQHQDSRRYGSRTEPYYPNSCYFESPLAGSPTNGDWTHHYEIVQPLQHDPYYPRTYQVY